MPPIVQRLREAAAALRDERVTMRALAQAHGPEANGTLLLLLAMPCLLPVPGVGTVLGLGIAALAVAMWRGRDAPCLPKRVRTVALCRVRRSACAACCRQHTCHNQQEWRMGEYMKERVVPDGRTLGNATTSDAT
jgi:hypothetical protein